MATFPPTPSSAPSHTDPTALLQAGNEHVWLHASSWRALAANQEGKRIMVEGHGCIVKDIDGKEYIDGLAGLWLVNVGHGRKEIGKRWQRRPGPWPTPVQHKRRRCRRFNSQHSWPRLPLGISPPCFFAVGAQKPSSQRSRLPDNISISPAFQNVLRSLGGVAPTMGQRLVQ